MGKYSAVERRKPCCYRQFSRQQPGFCRLETAIPNVFPVHGRAHPSCRPGRIVQGPPAGRLQQMAHWTDRGSLGVSVKTPGGVDFGRRRSPCVVVTAPELQRPRMPRPSLSGNERHGCIVVDGDGVFRPGFERETQRHFGFQYREIRSADHHGVGDLVVGD